MNKLILALALCAALPAAANTQKDYDEMCASRAELAEQVMRARQIGMPLAQLLDVLKADASPRVERDFRSLAIQAYEQPRYRGEQMQRRAAEDFRDEAHVSCLRIGPRNKPTKVML